MVVTPGQRHESTQMAAVLDAIRAAHPEGFPGDGHANVPSTSSPSGATATRVPEAAAFSWHPARHPRARGPARAPPGPAAEVRPRGLLQAQQRGGEVCEPAQAVEGRRHTLREAGRQLPGGHGRSVVDDLAILVNRQTGLSVPKLRGRTKELRTNIGFLCYRHLSSIGDFASV